MLQHLNFLSAIALWTRGPLDGMKPWFELHFGSSLNFVDYIINEFQIFKRTILKPLNRGRSELILSKISAFQPISNLHVSLKMNDKVQHLISLVIACSSLWNMGPSGVWVNIRMVRGSKKTGDISMLGTNIKHKEGCVFPMPVALVVHTELYQMTIVSPGRVVAVWPWRTC